MWIYYTGFTLNEFLKKNYKEEQSCYTLVNIRRIATYLLIDY